MKKTAVIVDDESDARQTLHGYIQRYCPSIEIIGEAFDVPSAVEVINSMKPEIVFLDIEIPFGNAFDVLDATRDINFETIFVTAYSEYALKAINFNAAYYILKPVDIDELIQAVERASENLDKSGTQTITEIIRSNLQHPDKKKLVVPNSNGFDVIPVDEIIRFEGSGNYTEIYLTENRKKTVTKVLKHFEDLVSDLPFMRVHKSHLVNMHHISSYFKGRGGTAIMADGVEIEISIHKKDEFLAWFGS